MTVDGASNYKKCFRLFGRKAIDSDGTNETSLDEIREEFIKDDKEEEFEDLEDEIRNDAGVEDDDIEMINLDEIWDESISLPRRIRCFVHLLALLGVVKFSALKWKTFWALYGGFKSKFILFNLVKCSIWYLSFYDRYQLI